jgi:hypothetical protein
MSNQSPSLAPLVGLHDALRRVTDELERSVHDRRLHAERLQVRWRGGRRDEFEAGSAELDAITRRVLADLRAARTRTAALLDGRR